MALFSQTGEYALRAATYLAQHGDEGHVMAKEIAKATRIPEKYLQKILRDLVHIGLLTSTRGYGGGFKLAKPASRIRLAHVVSPFEQLSEHTRCPFGNRQCGKANPCPIHDRWENVARTFNEFLQQTNLANLAGK